MQLSQGSLLGEDCIHGFGKNGDDASASGVPLDVVEEDATPSMARSSASPALRRCLGGFSKWMGKDHGTGAIYGFVNWIVCVPSLVSYAHIVFPQHEFREFLPSVVKIFFLSSAVMQVAMTLLSEIQFAIGQIQDVGLIFLAGMVRNIVHMGHADRAVSSDGLMATSMWTCFCSTFVVGFALIAIGALKMIQYVQMLPLPVVGGYLGYIGYFCFAAGLAIGTGKEVNGPETLLQLWDHTLLLKESLLFIFAAVMIFVHFKVKHFLAMPVTLLTLPVLFFVGAFLVGASLDDCRARGLLPYPRDMSSFKDVFTIVEPSEVHWHMMLGQKLNLLGLITIVTFGSSLDVAAIQAELPDRKLDYNRELQAIGFGNVCSSLVCGATGSYIFSQTIFSAKRSVSSRVNGLVVAIGEFILFFAPVDILQVLPNAYVGGIMCLFGVDIMTDWLFKSKRLMSKTEYALVWISFVCTMYLTGQQTFGVIEGMAIGTFFAAVFFAVQFAKVQEKWHEVSSRSSVVRRPQERRHLNGTYNSILAVSLNSYAFFGTSFTAALGIEQRAKEQGARFVCLDLGRVSGMDCTFADQTRLLVLSLEREGAKVLLSSLRSKTVRRLLDAHGICNGSSRKVFNTLDQAIQHCEDLILAEAGKLRKPHSGGEWPLQDLLLEYVEGFIPDGAKAREAAATAAKHFERIQLKQSQLLFRSEDPADAIFVVAQGVVGAAYSTTFLGNLEMLPSPPSSAICRQETPQLELDFPFVEEVQADGRDFEEHGVGAILNDAAFYARRKCGADAVAKTDCVVFRLPRKALARMEEEEPGAAVLLQKVLLRDLSQLMAQFLCPLQAVAGLS